MNMLGPLALPVTSFRKSTPSTVNVSRGSSFGSFEYVQVPSLITTS